MAHPPRRRDRSRLRSRRRRPLPSRAEPSAARSPRSRHSRYGSPRRLFRSRPRSVDAHAHSCARPRVAQADRTPQAGWNALLEEADSNPVETLDRTGWHDVSRRVFPILALRGSKVDWARDLPYLVAQRGLQGLRAEAEHPYFFGASDLAEFWKISWRRVRDGVAASGGDVTEWDRELAELDDPTRLFVGPMTVSVIASKNATSVRSSEP